MARVDARGQGKISCARCAQLMTDLLDGDCGTRELKMLRGQVESRDCCHDCYTSYQQIAALCCEAANAAEPPSGFAERLADFLCRHAGNRSRQD